MIAACPLPQSGLVLSPLGLGTAALGDRHGPDADSGAAETVDRALASGISYVLNENGALLPGPGAILADPTFAEWLDSTP